MSRERDARRTERRLHLCRPGFEAECAGEIEAVAAALGARLAAAGDPGSGRVMVCAPGGVPAGLERALGVPDLVFTRQCFGRAESIAGLPPGDRVAALVAHAAGTGQRFADALVEHADDDEGRALARLARGLRAPLDAALRAAGLLGGGAGARRLHVLLLSGREALAGSSEAHASSRHPGGIPRLRMPAGAPSRSALKLEEALATFLAPGERDRALRPGLAAVDLGASPGGWTRVLAGAGLEVTAIDNGGLDEALLANPRVRHVRADGFAWRPRRAVDWMVCDIADKPLRVARLVAEWGAAGLFRNAVFNLKLPMRRRLDIVVAARSLIGDALRGAGRGHALRFAHLYHDRAEVTGWVRLGRGPGGELDLGR